MPIKDATDIFLWAESYRFSGLYDNSLWLYGMWIVNKTMVCSLYSE
jgi:hypothetical protein